MMGMQRNATKFDTAGCLRVKTQIFSEQKHGHEYHHAHDHQYDHHHDHGLEHLACRPGLQPRLLSTLTFCRQSREAPQLCTGHLSWWTWAWLPFGSHCWWRSWWQHIWNLNFSMNVVWQEIGLAEMKIGIWFNHLTFRYIEEILYSLKRFGRRLYYFRVRPWWW